MSKEAAIEQWTADPCGSTEVEQAPDGGDYFRALVAMRTEYAPWMDEALDYETANGLDVLDVGCGQGIDLARYAEAGAHVVGIDLTPRHVDLARAHLAASDLRGTVVQGDAERLPFADASFDRISSNGVLHHTPDIAAALREIRRVLRPGGRATVIVYNKLSLHYWVDQVLLCGVIKRGLLREGSMAGVLSAGVERSSIGARPLVQVYTPHRVRRMMADAGLTDVGTDVRHLRHNDAFLLPIRDRRILDRLGRVAGWYVVGHGIKPAASRATS